MERNDWREELQGIIEEEETDMERPMIPRYAKGYAKLVLENFISSVIEKERKKLVSDINDALKDGIKNNESVSKVIEKIDIKVFDVDESSTIRVDMVNMVDKEIDKAREEVLLELLEKKTNYKIEEVGHGYKVTQEYVLVSDIEKELSKLSNKYHGEKYSKKIYKPTKSRKLRPSNEDSKTTGK